MKRLASALPLVAAVTLATATLVTVLGSVIGFYDWMWVLMLLGVGVGFGLGMRPEDS